MSKNKLAKFEEMNAFENVIQAPYHSLKNNHFYLKGFWTAHFFKNNHPLILELGCGKGEYTVELAERFPGKNFIGVDIKGARMWKGAKTAREKKLENVAFLRTNIEIIDRFFGKDEVDEIWLTFPDPQMKKTRKRLTSTRFLNKYRTFLKREGTIHLKTDSLFQYTYSCALARHNHFDILGQTGDLYQSALLNEPLEIKTFYEKQWLNRGFSIKYLAFRLNDTTLEEPPVKPEKDPYRSFGRSARE